MKSISVADCNNTSSGGVKMCANLDSFDYVVVFSFPHIPCCADPKSSSSPECRKHSKKYTFFFFQMPNRLAVFRVLNIISALVVSSHH